MNYKLKKISGDASYREYYRLEKNKKTSIIVFARQEKYKNLIVYSAVNKILNKNNILAPRLLNFFVKENIIEITDLGEVSFLNFIKDKKNKSKEYKKLIDLIIKMQKIKLKNNYKFKNFYIKFNKYSINELNKETDLFFDWYIKFVIKNKSIKNIKKTLKQELNIIYKKIYLKNNYFIHRDFHA
jgi:aminoglycoside/choline kinase family phosphotransferase